jgi:hypothetical protein
VLFALFSVRLCLFAGDLCDFFARRHGDFFFAWFPGTLFLNFRTRGNFKSKRTTKTAKSAVGREFPGDSHKKSKKCSGIARKKPKLPALLEKVENAFLLAGKMRRGQI